MTLRWRSFVRYLRDPAVVEGVLFYLLAYTRKEDVNAASNRLVRGLLDALPYQNLSRLNYL